MARIGPVKIADVISRADGSCAPRASPPVLPSKKGWSHATANSRPASPTDDPVGPPAGAAVRAATDHGHGDDRAGTSRKLIRPCGKHARTAICCFGCHGGIQPYA